MSCRLKRFWGLFLLALANGYVALAADEPPTGTPRERTAQDSSERTASTDPSSIRQGRVSYLAFCSRCHGRDAEGAKGPSLIDSIERRVATDQDIVDAIANGFTGTGMAGFGPGFEDEYWHVVAYLRSEQAKQLDQQGQVAGNTQRGFELFRKHRCTSCHWDGTQGGRIGTDLSRSTSTAAFIRKSLTDPDAQIDVSHQAVQIVLDDGRQSGGRRLHENSHFILLIDGQENLLAVAKKQIDLLSRPHQSLMPNFGRELSEADVNDLTAYLLSLQQGPEK